ncbi:MAG: hypothetical protein AVDCRST_MAG75-939, partial [uncultured Propionibacteriaceae bacterium]
GACDRTSTCARAGGRRALPRLPRRCAAGSGHRVPSGPCTTL